jgi:hypothetical protein
MALVRWDPARQLDTFQSDLDRVFDAFFGGRTANGTTRRWVPAMDLVETDDQLVLRADLPGLDADDVEIEVKDGVLTVSGERRTEHEDSADGYHRVERAYWPVLAVAVPPAGHRCRPGAGRLRQGGTGGAHPEARGAYAAPRPDRRERRGEGAGEVAP